MNPYKSIRDAALWTALKKAKIEMPYPQHVIQFKRALDA
jgi:hypothetical protein